MPKSKILVVEDEPDIAQVLVYNLEADGFQVALATTGDGGLNRARNDLPDLIVLDLMLPEINGLDVCRILKSEPKTQHIPIIILTAKNEDIDVVTGLEVGADDYVTKPFSPRVLIARIRALMRRRQPVDDRGGETIRIGRLTLDETRHHATIDGHPLDLTATEFQLLAQLCRHPGWVFSRTQLIDIIHDGRQVITGRAIDVQVANLRKKLGDCSHYVETVRGVGYRMAASI